MSKSSFIKLILTLVIALVAGVGWKILNPDRLTTIEALWIIDPVTQGGKKLPGTEGVEDFTVSPDGQWILYSLRGAQAFSSPYFLYGVKKHEQHEIALTDSCTKS
jgi:hypothetical protein